MTSIVYTDGACSHEGIGGWAWVAYEHDVEVDQAWGWRVDTTNNQMELKAVLEALRSHPTGELEIVSDSAYVINCFSDRWYDGWRKRGWLNSKNQAVANRELWEIILARFEQRADPVVWTHVRGHGKGGSVPGNDRADQLAVDARIYRTDHNVFDGGPPLPDFLESYKLAAVPAAEEVRVEAAPAKPGVGAGIDAVLAEWAGESWRGAPLRDVVGVVLRGLGTT